MPAFSQGPRPSRSSPRLLPASLICSLIGSSLLLVACGKEPAAAQGAGGSMPPPPEVSVIAVTPGTVGLNTELPGRLEASRVAQVRARAAGILQQRLFKEGSDVRAGQPLFAIDSAPYRASVDSALV